MSDSQSFPVWRRRAGRGIGASPVRAGDEGRECPPRDARKRILTFLALTVLFTAVSAASPSESAPEATLEI